jgi:hypothetical protein
MRRVERESPRSRTRMPAASATNGIIPHRLFTKASIVMSTKKNKERSSRGSLRSVPSADRTHSGHTASAGEPSGAASKVWLAIQDKPGCTAAQIALAGGVSGSAARKALATLAQDGWVIREPSGQRGVGDRWQVANATHDSSQTTPCPAPEASLDTDTTAEPAVDTAAHSTDDDQGQQTVAAEDQPGEGTSGTDTAAQPDADASAADEATEAPATDSADATPTSGQDAGSVTDPRQRLAPGQLRGQIEDWLRDHPTQEFSPGEISKKLRRSAGAIANACEKLVSDGTAVKTNEKPKRYRIGDDHNG